jgi:uncharacterized RDD family membrane protein YckC
VSSPFPADANPYAPPRSPLGDLDLDHAARGPATFHGYAGFWRRFSAYFIDSIILRVAGGVFYLLAFGAFNAATQNQGRPLGLSVTLGVQGATYLMYLLYFAAMECSSSQGTLGKMAMGLKVVDLRGRRVTFWRAAGRNLAKVISALPLLFGFIMAGFTEKKQALHDMIASSLVVRAR